MIPIIPLLLIAGLLVASESITIFAGASTADALGELGRMYAAAQRVTVVGNFASSSALVRQIEQGAPADLFLSADQTWMDAAQARNLIRVDSRRDLLGNQLVVVAPRGHAFAVQVAPDFAFAAAFSGRLAIGDPASVPAGTYAKEALERLGWWPQLEARLAPGADVRAALRLVELGEADAGIVYRTDALRSAKVEIIGAIPAHLHRPIGYPIALTTGAKPAAQAFLVWLASEEALAVWRRHGFVRAPDAAAP